MVIRILSIFVFPVCLLSGTALAQQKVIFETDMGPDIDDAAALGMLHVLMDKGEIELLAVMQNTSYDKGAAAIDAINTYYGRPDMPIGKYVGTALPYTPGWGTQWWNGLGDNRETYGHNVTDLAQVPDAVSLYKSILATQPENSVVIVSVGHLTNIDRLLQDEGGMDLVSSKVSELVVIGGGFKKQKVNWEHNLTRGGDGLNWQRVVAASDYVVENWPKPMTFLGFEIGMALRGGEQLKDTPQTNPVREAYRLHHTEFTKNENWDWAMFDQSAVLYAARRLGPADSYWTRQSGGTLRFDADQGKAWFDKSRTTAGHSFIKPKMANEPLADIIESLMVQAPASVDE